MIRKRPSPNSLPAGTFRTKLSLHTGEFFGEVALLSAEPRTATVQAVTDCQLYELSKRAVDALCEVCPGLRDVLTAAYRARSARR